MSTKPTFVVREKNHPNVCSCRQTVPTQQIASHSGTRMHYILYIMPSIENYVYQHVQYYIHIHGCTTIECSTYVRSRTISVAAIENTPSLNAVQQISNKSTLRVHFRGPGGAFAPPPPPPLESSFSYILCGIEALGFEFAPTEICYYRRICPLLSEILYTVNYN